MSFVDVVAGKSNSVMSTPATDSKLNADASTSVGRLRNFFIWLYLQYLLVTALYMLEPWERTVFNIIVVCLVITFAYSLWTFLPSLSISAVGSILGFGGLAASGNSVEL